MSATLTKMYADLLRNDLVAFARRSFLELNPGSQFLMNWHLEAMAAWLEEARRGRFTRVGICLPPRHLKSFLASVVFPAWILGHDPTKQIMCVSYGQELADKLARQTRALMESEYYRYLFPTRLSDDRQAVAEFETTRGGYRIATSVGGRVTGFGGNFIILDDPLKAEDALSDVKRKGCNEWFDNTLRSRLNRPAEDAIILVTQRLHADDLVSHVQRDERWEMLELAAVAEKRIIWDFPTPYGWRSVRREVGDVLHPAVLPRAELERLKRAMPEYHFSAQYQQNPLPPSGSIVSPEWLQTYDEGDRPQNFDMVLQSWDTANKATELSDYTVCTTWGIKGAHMYLLDVVRERLEFPALKQRVIDLYRLWDAQVVLIEDKASGTQLIQELRADGFDRVEAAPLLDGDKIMRLRAQTAKIEGGFVLLPQQAPWLGSYRRELLGFPNSKYDDQVDSTVFALAWRTLNPRPSWNDKCDENFQTVLTGVTLAMLFGPRR